MRKSPLIAATLILAVGTAAHAEPAWQRIAKKLKQNSLEENAEVVEAEAPAEASPALPEPRMAAARPSEALLPQPDAPVIAEQGTVGLATRDGDRRGRGRETMNLGLESEEAGVTTNLFDDPNVLRMLGEEPRFVYGSIRRPDPMIFPPARNAAIYAEQTLAAERALEAGNLEAAVIAYRRILDLKDRRYTAEVRAKIGQLNAMIGSEALANLPAEEEIVVELPTWVRDNTRGVLFEEDAPMCLVGDFLLKVGDEVPSYPNVTVGSIGKRQVTFRVSDQESFDVDVKGYDE